jgi:NADH dehydrogenase
MREAIELILRVIDRHPALLPLPFGLAKLKAAFLQFAPGDLKLTPDQVELLKVDNVVSGAAKSSGLTLEGLGIAPESMAAILPSYLWRFRKTGQFAHKDA